MTRQKNSKIVNLITWLLLLLLLVGGIGAICHFSGVNKDDIKDMLNPVFRVEYDGKEYTGSDNVIDLPTDGQAKFAVKGTNGYKVKVLPNAIAEADITYSVDGTPYAYSEENLTSVFVDNDSVYAECFYVNCMQSYALIDVLSRLWGGRPVEIKDGEINNPYKIVITSSNGEAIELLFGGANFFSLHIVLDKVEIVF